MDAANLTIGVPKETQENETRVAMTPDIVKKLIQAGFQFCIEKDAGEAAGFPDESYPSQGVTWGSAADALGADIVAKVNKPRDAEIALMRKKSLLFAFLEPYAPGDTLQQLAQSGVNAVAMEMIPRTSRAQAMDVLSSQANIAGYRAVIEAVARYPRFFPMMMTSAGSAKPAKVIVLGAGVAGLQAIGTARRLGAQVEAYDVRPEVKEQIQSLGAKFIELDIGEAGSGTGGYAKELSGAAVKRQQEALSERLKKADVIISTANIPGRRAPVLITEDAVRGMRPGSVIVDLAAANGGNCPLSEPNKIVVKHGVTLVGIVNYPALMPSDASSFYARNIFNLLALFKSKEEGKEVFSIQLEDDIIAASLVTLNGEVRLASKKDSPVAEIKGNVSTKELAEA